MIQKEKIWIGKRGDGGVTWQTILAILAVIIVFLIGYALWYYYTTGVFPWTKNLPEPVKNGGVPEINMAIVRYSIGEGDVQYYDGLNWNKFPDEGKIKFEDNIIYRYLLTKDFEKAYFAPRNKKVLNLLGQEFGLIERLNQGPQNAAGAQLRAYTDVTASAAASEGAAGTYAVNYNNDVYKLTAKSEEEQRGSLGMQEAGRVQVERTIPSSGNPTLKISFYPQFQDNLFSGDIINYLSNLAKKSKVFSGKEISNLPPLIDFASKAGEDKYSLELIDESRVSPEEKRFAEQVVYKLWVNEKETSIDIILNPGYTWDMSGAAKNFETGYVYGFIYALPSPEKKYEKITSLNNYEKEMAQEVDAWRDGILSKPINIRLGVINSDNTQSLDDGNYYCGSMISINGGKYIVVDLSKKAAGETCSL